MPDVPVLAQGSRDLPATKSRSEDVAGGEARTRAELDAMEPCMQVVDPELLLRSYVQGDVKRRRKR